MSKKTFLSSTFMFMFTFFVGALIPINVHATEPEMVGTVGVDGLACPFCAYGLEKKLSKLDFVKSLTIDLDGGYADFVLKKGKTPRFDEVKAAVKDAGFTAKYTSLKMIGHVEKIDGRLYLVTQSEARVLLSPSKKRKALEKALSGAKKTGAKKTVEIKGKAESNGSEVVIVIDSFKVQ